MRYVATAVFLLLATISKADLASVRAAAENGDPVAQYNLAIIYAVGEEVARDINESIKWARLSAQQGNVDAQRNLGLMFSKSGPEPLWNSEESFMWFSKAAEQGDAEGQFNIGLAYIYGDGIKKDPERALKFWNLAAAQNFPSALYYLGLCYLNGDNVGKDFAEARRLFHRASLLELAEAQYTLALMQWKADGGEQNKVEAFAWMTMARRAGHKDAERLLDLMKPHMTSEDVADGMMRTSAISREINAAKRKQP